MRAKVKDIMTCPVITIDKNRKLSDAITMMEKHKVSRLVVSNSKRLSGILTKKDITEHLGSSKHGKIVPSTLHVSTVATSNLITISEEDNLKTAAKLIIKHRISSLPVVREGDGDGDGDLERNSSRDDIVGIITTTDLLKPLTDSDVKLGEIMTKRVRRVSPTERVVHARRIMIDENISRLVVVEDGNVRGVVTEKDTAKILFEFRKATDRHQYARIRNIPVEDVMTKDVFTLPPTSTAGEASRTMLDRRFSGIPIVEDGKLVGIVTKTDMAKLHLS